MSDKTELLRGIVAVVQYRQKDSPGGWWTMAAFDSETMAERYAEQCAKQNSPWEYRAVPLSPPHHIESTHD